MPETCSITAALCQDYGAQVVKCLLTIIPKRVLTHMHIFLYACYALYAYIQGDIKEAVLCFEAELQRCYFKNL
jgi:hypothetical protein